MVRQRMAWRVVAGVLLAALVLAGYYVLRHNETPANAGFVIRVEGDRGVHFRGNYVSVNARGNSVLRRVSGVTPAQYLVGAGTVMVSLTIQKAQAQGLLRVAVEHGGRTLALEQTDAAFGGVTAAVRLTSGKPNHLRSTDRFSPAP